MHNKKSIKVWLCFQRPKPGNYIGGVVTLCDNYISYAKLFEKHKIDVECFNYTPEKVYIYNKIKGSKLRNIIYGVLQAFNFVKKVNHFNQPQILHIHSSRSWLFLKDVLLAEYAKKKTGIKTIITIHVGDINTVFSNKFIQKLLIRRINNYIDKVIFLSEKMRLQFIEAGMDERIGHVLYNFFNVETTSPYNKIDTGTKELLYIGSINREKGIIEMLEALSNTNKSFHLNLCGSILEKEFETILKNYIEKLGDKVTFHGYADHKLKNELLKLTDILILPSYREGLPISILEAMANSCAIITTPVGAIPEIIKENENALLISPRDVEQLQNAIESLLDDESALNKMKNANYQKSKAFTPDSHISSLCKIYQ